MKKNLLSAGAAVSILFARPVLAHDCNAYDASTYWQGSTPLHTVSEICHFRDGLAAIRYADRWGFVDTAGDMVIEPRFEAVGPMSEGLAPARDDFLAWGYIDRNGRWVIAPAYDAASPFHEGAALVKLRDGSEALIDRQGKVFKRIPAGMELIWSFHRGTTAARLRPPHEIRHRDGRHFPLAPGIGDVGPAADGLIRAAAGEAEAARYGFLDEHGAWAIAPVFSAATGFYAGFAGVTHADGGAGLIDRRGAWAHPQRYAAVQRAANGFWLLTPAEPKDGIDVFDAGARPLRRLACADVREQGTFKDWLAVSGCGTSWLLHPDGRALVYAFEAGPLQAGADVAVLRGPIRTEAADPGAATPEPAYRSGGFAVVTAAGRTLLSSDDPAMRDTYAWAQIAQPASAFATAHPDAAPLAVLGLRQGGGLAILAADGQVVSRPEWRNDPASDGMADGGYPSPDGDREGPAPMPTDRGWGAVDGAGRWVIEPRYDALGGFRFGLAFARQNDQTLLVDVHGTAHAIERAADAERVAPGVVALMEGSERVYHDLVHGRVLRRVPADVADQTVDVYPAQDARSGLWGLKGDAGWILPPGHAEAAEPLELSDGSRGWRLRHRPEEPNVWGLERAYGFADASGRLRLPPRFASVYAAQEGAYLSAGRTPRTAGLLTLDGATVMPARAAAYTGLGDGWYRLHTVEQGGLVDARGEWRVPPVHPGLFWSEPLDFVPTVVDGDTAFVDRTGRISTPAAPVAPDEDRPESWHPIRSPARDETAFYGFDWSRRLVARGDVQPFAEGTAVFMEPGTHRYGLIDASGKVLVPARYDYMESMRDGLVKVGQLLGEDAGSMRFGYIDRAGRPVLPVRYGASAGFSGGYAPVIQGAAIGIIDRSGAWILRTERRCGREVVLNARGRTVWPKGFACSRRASGRGA